MVGEAEVVVRAEQQDGLAVEQDARALRARDTGAGAGRARGCGARPGVPRCRSSLRAASRRRARSPDGVGRAVGARRDRRLALRCAAAWRDPRSSRIGLASRRARRSASAASRRRASRSGCRAAGWRRCPSWRATFRPSSSNIARSCSGSEPSVVRKLPIITPLRPALTASRCTRVAEVLDAAAAEPEERVGQDQPEDRDPLDGLPRVHESRSPNFVPGRGLSRLIGTLVGSISASSKAISTRCSRDSPRLRMPPTHVSRPASRTASIVRSRPS